MDGNVTLGKLNYRKCSTFLTDTVFNITSFSHKMYCSIGSVTQHSIYRTTNCSKTQGQEWSTRTQNSVHDNVEIMKNDECGTVRHSHKFK
jgi:hypothetical protein